MYCTYCKRYATHTVSSCPRLSAPRDNNSGVACYNCGEVGFIRQNCPKCNSVSVSSCFYACDVPVKENVNKSGTCKDIIKQGESGFSGNRTLLHIGILGSKGTALVDTAAKKCIAGSSLYALLVEKGHPMTDATQTVILADGKTQVMDVKKTMIDVQLLHKTISVEFMIMLQASNNESLLGIDFIVKANLSLDFGRSVWCFSENPTIHYELIYESGI